MFYRARRAWNYWRYDRIVSGIFETAPVVIKDSDLRIVSMVAERDIPMYLVAAKVLYWRIRHGRFVLIVDRALPRGQRDLLRRHLGDAVDFIVLEDIEVGRCQRGGTWERVLTCVDLSADHYVLQMDADTLALGEIPEVLDAIETNRACTVNDGIPTQGLAEAAAWMDGQRPSMHIIDATQRAFAQHPRRDELRYLRGTSGFAGFAKGGVSRPFAEQFHVDMEAILGRERWREWGTEQVASNFLVANSPDPVLLPYPAYCSVGPRTDWRVLRFGHFIGTYRFDGQRFAREGARLISASLPRPN